MGFCTKCGAENADGAKFCRSCGTPLQAADSSAQQAAGSEGAGLAQPQMNGNVYAAAGGQQAGAKTTGSFMQSLKKVPGKIWAGIVAAVVAIVAIVVVVTNLGSTVNLNKFLTIETSGYDGYGRAKASIDWEAVGEQYNSKMSFTGNAKKEYGNLLKLTSPAEVLSDYVRVNIENKDHLSNGDEVAYTIEVDEKLYEYLKCKVKSKDDSFTIEDLTPVGKFDAFADLEVSFSGVAPDGYMDMDYCGSELDSYDFYCNERSGLSNGDTVKVTIDESVIANCAERLGKVPEASEKEYTVKGLSSYVKDLSEITPDALDKMKKQAEDVYNAHVARSWGDGEKLMSFDYLGEYLLTPKNDGGYNNLYLVYKAKVHNTAKDDDKVVFDQMTDVYWYILYRNIMTDGENNIDFDVTYYDTVGNTFYVKADTGSWWSSKSWYYYGYETLDELYKNVVTSNMDKYNHQENIENDAAASSSDTYVSEASEEEADTDQDYIIPDSDKRLLTKDDLEDLSEEECKLARNEIYARHGRKFKDDEIQSYFDSKDWYEGSVEPDDFKEEYLPEIERKNVQFITDYEEEKGYK